MSQTVFGQKLGVTQVTVSRWEAGWCVPDLARLMDICRLLEFDLAELDPLQVAS